MLSRGRNRPNPLMNSALSLDLDFEPRPTYKMGDNCAFAHRSLSIGSLRKPGNGQSHAANQVSAFADQQSKSRRAFLKVWVE